MFMGIFWSADQLQVIGAKLLYRVFERLCVGVHVHGHALILLLD